MPYTKGNLFPCNPSTQRLVAVKLDVDPKGERITYVNGRTAIIRSLDPSTPSAISYSQHTQPLVVSRISPSGYYCATADNSGTVRIWDIAGTDQTLKLETKALGGRINDLAWDGESKRVIVGGEGKDAFGAAFLMDSGSSCGVIQGHSKSINAVTTRHQRPFRAATASDDGTIVFYTGVPYKYEKIIRTHTRFVQDVRFSHSGDLLASVGSDGKLFIYDGKDGSTVGEVEAGRGKSVMACSWSRDSREISTAGADGTVKIWDAETRKNVTTFEVGTDILSQQNGNVWASENAIVSVGLDGVLNVFDPRAADGVRRLYGPTKSITAATLTTVPEPTFYAGSFDGAIKGFNVSTGECFPATASGEEGQIAGLAVDQKDGKVWATGWGASNGLGSIEGGKGSSLKSSPSGGVDASKSIGANSGVTAVADVAGLIVSRGGKVIKKITAPDGFSSAAVTDGFIAFGGVDKKIHLATLSGDNVEEVAAFDDSRGEVISLAFSPDGSLLAGGDTSGRIVLIDVKQKSVLVSSKWTAHTARATCLSFSPDGKRLVSGGLDEQVIIWSVAKTLRNVPIKNSHAGGVRGVAWADDETVISAGADACVRTWKISGI